MWSPRSLFAAALAGLFLFGIVGGAPAQVRIDIPGRRSSGQDGPSAGDVIGGLLALKGGFDRSRRGHICVLTYDDANGDGARDRKEGPLPGWPFRLSDTAGRPVAQGVTDGKGRFCNDRPLAPGVYTLSETPGGGWVNTDPGGWTTPVTLPADRSVIVMFGNCHGERCGPRTGPAGPAPPSPQGLGKICAIKFNDFNGNGARDPGEPLLPAWSFTVSHGSGAVVTTGVTDAQGQYCTGQTLPPGAYVLAETVQPGWVSTTPGGPSRNVTLMSNHTWTWSFGNRQTSTGARVCVTKYNDLNGNGVRDAGEGTLSGWLFTVRNSSNLAVASGTTNAQGEYCTAPLTPGPYSVTETLTGGWISTMPGGPSRAFNLHQGQTWTASFGNQLTPSTNVCIKKFNDLNGDGIRQGNEPGLGGWTFQLNGPAGGPSLTTGSNGGACFQTGYAAGVYTATETPQTGWSATTPGGAVQTFTLVPTQNVALVFGNRQTPPTARVCVAKYNDLNGNGSRDAGEPLMPGWIFTVKNASGAVVAFGTTGAQGQWCSTPTLVSGPATIVETLKPGWISTNPGGALPTMPLTLVSGQTVNVAFGNRTLPPPPAVGQICVAKYYDLNRNGVYVSGEPLLSGWQFSLTGPSGPVNLTTGANGTACTPVNLLLGTYVVAETMKPGWSSTAPGGLAPQRTVAVAAGPNGTGVMFGNINTLPGQVCVNKYHDVNRNHQRDAGEPALAGWTFEVRNSAGVLVASGVTDAQGRYCTGTNLAPGSYTVIEVPKPWWVATDPQGPPLASPPYDKTTVLTATRGGEVHFGNIPSGRACVLKYNDLNGNGHRDPGEPPLAGWSFSFRYQGATNANQVVLTTDASGMACLDLPPGGSHEVDEILQPGWTSTDPGPYAQTSAWVFKVFSVVEGQTTQLLFGNHQNAPPQPGVVCIVKYNDIDQDAVFDTGEARLAGWQFNLKTAAGVAVGTVTTGPQGRICKEMPSGTYAAFEIPQAGWSNSDPVGPALDKPFTIVAGQTVNLVFGNYQPPILRFRKVVLSNAPGGGFPLTGLAFGNHFQVQHSCVLGNQTGGNMTNVPANGVSPMAGYTGNSVGAVCTASETPPPGLIAFAPCPTGKGHWATPIISPLPLTIAPAMNEITVTNQFVCEKTPPPTGKLCVHKFNDLNGDASFALNEPGLAGWQFTVTGPSGPITLTTGANGRACTDGNLIFGTYTITETPQAGWVSTLPGGATPQQTGAVTAAGIPSFTFGNRAVAPPAQPRLTISKSFDNSCTSVQGITNPCIFRIRILNVDTIAYVGPATFSDTVGFMGNITVANSTLLVAPLPAGWSCSTNGPPISCSGAVNLAPGQFVDIVLTVNLFHPVMPLKNCVSLTVPINAGPACIPF